MCNKLPATASPRRQHAWHGAAGIDQPYATERALPVASSAGAERLLIQPLTLPRHTLVWPQPQASWQALTPGAQTRLQAWFAAGHPAIVARADASEAAGMLRLGVPLPRSEGKQRLALRMHSSQLARRAPPPLLSQIAAACAVPALQQLASMAAGYQPRVFGSHAWQWLTGLDYVHADSDLDLLWSIEHAAQADAIVALLQQWEAGDGCRADGELLLPGQMAVNWREYQPDDAANRPAGGCQPACRTGAGSQARTGDAYP
jgi:phosphoribosyl-dephospho-CoA transferase